MNEVSGIDFGQVRLQNKELVSTAEPQFWDPKGVLSEEADSEGFAAQEARIEVVRELQRQYDQTLSPDEKEDPLALLEDPNGRAVVMVTLYDGEKPIANCMVGVRNNFSTGPENQRRAVISITNAIVHRDYRGNGAMTKIMNSIIAQAPELLISQIEAKLNSSDEQVVASVNEDTYAQAAIEQLRQNPVFLIETFNPELASSDQMIAQEEIEKYAGSRALEIVFTKAATQAGLSLTSEASKGMTGNFKQFDVFTLEDDDKIHLMDYGAQHTPDYQIKDRDQTTFVTAPARIVNQKTGWLVPSGENTEIQSPPLVDKKAKMDDLLTRLAPTIQSIRNKWAAEGVTADEIEEKMEAILYSDEENISIHGSSEEVDQLIAALEVALKKQAEEQKGELQLFAQPPSVRLVASR